MKLSVLPCQECRSRKKRCFHVDKVTKINRANEGGEDDTSEVSPANSQSKGDTRVSSPSPGPVSEYNPQYVLSDLLDASKSDGAAEKLDASLVKPDAGRHGSIQKSHRSHFIEHNTVRQRLCYYQQKRRVEAPKLSEDHRRYLEDMGVFMELPRTTTDALLPIYISILDDLIPVIDGPSVFRDYSNGQASPYLVKAICLVTCKFSHAAPFLRLREDGPLLDPLKFASKLLTSLDTAIRAELEPDLITRIQILALMHLNNDGPAGKDRAASHLSQAICIAWSMSLHFKIPGNPDQDICDLLWWSLRNFDRLNKPVAGAGPFMIDDTDIAIERIAPREDSYRTQLMGVALVLGDLMKKATNIYKASSTAIRDDCQDFPSLSDITVGTKFDKFHRWHRGKFPCKNNNPSADSKFSTAYLEIWYHMAAMLSCRYSGPNSVPYNRRLESAVTILDIVFHGGCHNLPPLPLVPYAMSMSTTVIYRALRDGQRNMVTASKELRQCYAALHTFRRRWTSINGVFKLLKQVLKILDQPRLQLEQSRNTSEGQDSGTRSDMGSLMADHGAFAPEFEHRKPEWSMNVGPVITAASDPVQTNQSNYESQAAVREMIFKKQLTEYALGMNGSYSQIDREFCDLFDFGIPNIFRDIPTSEIFHIPNDDETCENSDFQMPSDFASRELEFDCNHAQMKDSHEPGW